MGNYLGFYIMLSNLHHCFTAVSSVCGQAGRHISRPANSKTELNGVLLLSHYSDVQLCLFAVTLENAVVSPTLAREARKRQPAWQTSRR